MAMTTMTTMMTETMTAVVETATVVAEVGGSLMEKLEKLLGGHAANWIVALGVLGFVAGLVTWVVKWAHADRREAMIWVRERLRRGAVAAEENGGDVRGEEEDGEDVRAAPVGAPEENEEGVRAAPVGAPEENEEGVRAAPRESEGEEEGEVVAPVGGFMDWTMGWVPAGTLGWVWEQRPAWLWRGAALVPEGEVIELERRGA